MNHQTLLYIINSVQTYPELMTANTAFLEYVLTCKLTTKELDELYVAYNNKKQNLKYSDNIYAYSIKQR
jgi:hypothetical protein